MPLVNVAWFLALLLAEQQSQSFSVPQQGQTQEGVDIS